MKKIILLSLVIFLTAFKTHDVFAQKNFIQGFVVTHENDTTYGWIDYRNWSKNPSAISFRADSAAPAKKYSPGQIQSFQVAEDHYISREVSVDKTPDDINKLISSPITERDSLFLLAYVKGKTSLYYYEDEKPHFYIVEDSTQRELISRRLLRYRDDKRLALKQEEYKTQLRIYFRDCPEVSKDVDHLDYRTGDMVSIFRRYNECIGSESLYVKEKITSETEFRLIGGLSATTPSIKSPYSNMDDYGRSVNPVFGLSANIIFPRNKAKWSVYNELIYTAHFFNENSITSSKAGGSYLKMTNMVRYHLPGISSRPFMSLGVSNALALKIKESENVSEVGRKYLRGYVLGLGTHLQNLSVEIRYDLGSTVTKVYSYDFRIASITVGIPLN